MSFYASLGLRGFPRGLLRGSWPSVDVLLSPLITPRSEGHKEAQQRPGSPANTVPAVLTSLRKQTASDQRENVQVTAHTSALRPGGVLGGRGRCFTGSCRGATRRPPSARNRRAALTFLPGRVHLGFPGGACGERAAVNRVTAHGLLPSPGPLFTLAGRGKRSRPAEGLNAAPGGAGRRLVGLNRLAARCTLGVEVRAPEVSLVRTRTAPRAGLAARSADTPARKSGDLQFPPPVSLKLRGAWEGLGRQGSGSRGGLQRGRRVAFPTHSPFACPGIPDASASWLPQHPGASMCWDPFTFTFPP
ncbi:uncharacterized protein LOC144378457 [Ictidomys tridecemlineatus]